MKQIVMIVVLILLALFIVSLVTGCEEQLQHPTTADQMRQIEAWAGMVNQELIVLRNNTMYLRNHQTDPNEVRDLQECVVELEETVESLMDPVWEPELIYGPALEDITL